MKVEKVHEVQKVQFRDLTIPVKIGIIGGWSALIIYLLTFMLGFFGTSA